ncbi:carbohydrate-binding protein [Mariniblastus sp.]|nr:carbohydrate-binding protein [Mariniblastus sp.]
MELTSSPRLFLSAALVLLSCSLSFGDDVLWTGSVNSSWNESGNWNNATGPVEDDFALLTTGTTNYSTGTTPGLRGINQSGGTLNITGGTLEVARRPNNHSFFNSQVNQTGGFASINTVEIGSIAGTNGNYVLNGGELRIARAASDASLYIGTNRGQSNAGTGNLTVAGGSFQTRRDVRLGRSGATGIGSFTVLGSVATEISIGGAGDDFDGVWEQNTGSSLVVRTDFGGCTPIVLRDNGEEGRDPSVTFASGTLLDVDHLSGDAGGTWTVMEVENGDINDNGLAFASSVDTSIWSFEIDNSGANGKLLITAVGEPAGYPLIVGNTLRQKMRYGMDYERLWYWTGGLNDAERNDVAKWSAIDTRIDFIRVAMNGGYELEEGVIELSAYTNKIIPMMTKMQEANPDIKFFASPRPLNEAYPNKKWENEEVRWQPYPIWVTGAPTPISGNFNFNVDKCVQYIEDYLLLMDEYGFKISFMDLTNEWQSNDGGGRITQADCRDVTLAIKNSSILAQAGIEAPKFVAPSSWNYSQGANWISRLTTQQRRDAIDIAASHNTDKTGTAQQFGDAVRARFSGANDTMPEIWNTEVHGWKSTSSENETTTFSFYLEQIEAGFSGLTGWLAIGTTNQGHSFILNPNGRPSRNVKYFIFKKLSETSNYGHALNIIESPSQLSHTTALIRGNMMTVWVINQETSSVPVTIAPASRTISESQIKRTRWTDPSDVEGFVTFESVSSSGFVSSTIPGESVCCFEILLDPEDHPYTVVQAEAADEQNGMYEQQSTDRDRTLNLAGINDSSWARYNDIELIEDEAMRFRVARPSGREDGWVEVYLGAPGASTASILAGTPVGKVAVPETGGWQNYETIEAAIEASEGTYDIVLNFDEVGNDSNGALFNLNWFETVSPEPDFVLGDCNRDGVVDFSDISPFILILSAGVYLPEADITGDGMVDFDDISGFITLLAS